MAEVTSETPGNALYDNFGRIHNYLRLSITTQCNLRCMYCYPAIMQQCGAHSAIMQPEEIARLVSVFVGLGIKKVRLTGGEPLVRKEFAGILQLLAAYPVELALTTNGVYLDKYFDLFAKANLKSINVSLDTLQPQRFRHITGKDEFTRVKRNIATLLTAGAEVKVNVVLLKNVNDDEVIDFIEWTKNYPVTVRFIEFMPFKGNNWDWAKGVSANSVMNNIEEHYQSDVTELKNSAHSTARSYAIKGYRGSYALISSITNPFCRDCNRLRVSSDGLLQNCLFANSGIDLLTPLRGGEDIVPLIMENLKAKKATRAGFETISSIGKQKSRPMVAIGG